jgi:hypothetical protein
MNCEPFRKSSGRVNLAANIKKKFSSAEKIKTNPFKPLSDNGSPDMISRNDSSSSDFAS